MRIFYHTESNSTLSAPHMPSKLLSLLITILGDDLSEVNANKTLKSEQEQLLSNVRG